MEWSYKNIMDKGKYLRGRGNTENNQIFNRGETYSGWGDEVIVKGLFSCENMVWGCC